mmetsp:Transcript_53852/g.161131  ORF Transcript_53852/g.161131 Transcript_53852/m.161131 type:complete len:102 (+) Transcript_53852:130-435(+)
MCQLCVPFAIIFVFGSDIFRDYTVRCYGPYLTIFYPDKGAAKRVFFCYLKSSGIQGTKQVKYSCHFKHKLLPHNRSKVSCGTILYRYRTPIGHCPLPLPAI